MRFLSSFGFCGILTCMYIALTHQRKNGIPACRQGQFRKIYRVGTHVSNQSAFVQTLRNHHGLCHGIPKLTGSFLLECGSGKRRCRRLFNRPCSNIFYFKGSILTFLKETLCLFFCFESFPERSTNHRPFCVLKYSNYFIRSFTSKRIDFTLALYNQTYGNRLYSSSRKSWLDFTPEHR